MIQFDSSPTQAQQNPEEHFEDAVGVLPDTIQLTDESTSETIAVGVDNAPVLVDITSEVPLTNVTVENDTNIEANTETHVDTEVHVQSVNTAAVEEVLEEPAITIAAASEETVLPTAPPTLMYPTLDSLMAGKHSTYITYIYI